MKLKENKAIQDNNPYLSIDMVRTGTHLKRLTRRQGYTVKDIQRLLHLSCPQPVYRWFKGQALPSVDHLYTLSKLLHVHMEELLLPAETPPLHDERTGRNEKRGEKPLGCADTFIFNCEHSEKCGKPETDKQCFMRADSLISDITARRKCRQLALYWITAQRKTA